MHGVAIYFKAKLNKPFAITPLALLEAKDLNPTCKMVLEYMCVRLLAGNVFFESDKNIAKNLHLTPRTVNRIINKLITQHYIRVCDNKKFNYRYVTWLNLKKLHLQDVCYSTKKDIHPYRSHNNHHKIIRISTHKTHKVIPKHLTNKATHTKPITHKVHKSSSHISNDTKFLINQSAQDIADASIGYSVESAKGGIYKYYNQHKNTKHPLKVNNLFLALQIVIYRIQCNIPSKHPLGLIFDICNDGHENLLKRYKKIQPLIKNNKKKAIDKDYKIKGQCYLKVNHKTFKKNVNHKLATKQITKKQYNHFVKEYHKNGAYYTDKDMGIDF